MLSPRVRRNARERAMQFLFGLEFTRYDWQAVLDGFWETNLSGPSVKHYARHLIKGVMENLASLDREIDSRLERWSPGRVGHIERNILRVALYEIWFGPDVPRKVAINEAIEVAKRYGTPETPRFVNGVLDRIPEEAPRLTVT